MHAVRAFRAFAALALVVGTLGSDTASAAGAIDVTGINDDAAYRIEIPANWNGDLVLYSHGYVAPGAANPPTDVGDPLTGAYLKSQGYALAGSAYSSTGWAVKDALHDQI